MPQDDPASEIRASVKGLLRASPPIAVANGIAKVGDMVKTGADKASRAVEQTVQGTRRMLASKKQERGDIELQAEHAITPEATPQGTMRASVEKPRINAPKRLRKITVSKADNGGFIVSHHYRPGYGGTPKPERHAFAQYDDVHAHLEKMGQPKGGE